MIQQKDGAPKNIYKIRVHGYLDKRWAKWFYGFELKTIDEDTILLGCVPDQASPHGVLTKNEGFRLDDPVG